MDNSMIVLKPVKDLLGMNFFIPDYQRGYRWTDRQATDLLEDILTFANKKRGHTEIYCVQPLVVQKKNYNVKAEIMKTLEEDDDKFKNHVKKIISGTWNVVDGQQRLTTIYLILTALGNITPYEIDYETRANSKVNSKDFLANIHINQNGEMDNIDYYHISRVYRTIETWLANHSEQDKKKFEDALLDKVNFIWYQIADEEKDTDRQTAINAFKRLNIGKIPLTDAELVKALFLNRSNFNCASADLETEQRKIATEWDQIEYTLQDDAFWLFLHDKHYTKPTRIDFILDIICEEGLAVLSSEDRKLIEADEHQTFRYFYHLFSNVAGKDELKVRWKQICDYFRIFNEWFHDYNLYHYIGYLTTVYEDKKEGSAPIIKELVKMWRCDKAGWPNNQEELRALLDGTKEGFLKAIRMKIYQKLSSIEGFKNLDNYEYPNESKSRCVPILLLHNVETIIQQNQQLVDDDHYGMPNFTRFPFHLYKKENWDVEHIRPNAGDDLSDDEKRRPFVEMAKMYLPDEDELHQQIDAYLDDDTTIPFEQLKEKILQVGNSLGETDKNKIWNYTLLDRTTNQQYHNAIFPVKRAFLMNKERGKKREIDGGKLHSSKAKKEIAFVLPCTKNVFTKAYTDQPNGLLAWTVQDAAAYLADMKEKLAYYKETFGGDTK